MLLEHFVKLLFCLSAINVLLSNNNFRLCLVFSVYFFPLFPNLLLLLLLLLS